MIDAFGLKKINLLVVSYLIRQTHNAFIRENTTYASADKILDVYYSIGAIIGLLSTGLLCDFVIKDRNFLTIFVLNIVLFLWDIFLFAEASKGNNAQSESIVFSLFLGMILSSADLLYLLLIPFSIAKSQSEKMA